MPIAKHEREAAMSAMEAQMVMEDAPMKDNTSALDSPDIDAEWVARMAEVDEDNGSFVDGRFDDRVELINRGKKLWEEFASIIYEDDGTVKSQKFSYTRFGEWLLEESGEHYATLDDNDEIYYYKGGIYVPGGEVRIKYLVYGVMRCDLANTRATVEVVNYVRAHTATRRIDFDMSTDIINVSNGLYNISSGTFSKHTPEYKSFSKLDIEYDKNAKCPVVDYFIKDVVEPHRVDAMYEIIGYALLPRKVLKRGFIFTGASDTGKSTMITLLTDMVGGTNCVSSIAPNQMGIDTHAAFDLYGKLLNIVDDMGTAKINETGILKSIISSKPIRANQKYGKPFVFTPNTLFVLGCNVVPECDDEYMRDKFDILEFNNKHVGKDINETIDLELAVPSERSGLFNKAMIAVKTAIKNKTFTGSDTIERRAISYLHKSNPIALFVYDCIDTSDPEAQIEKKIFRQMYVSWSKAKGIKTIPTSKQTIYLSDNEHMLVKRGSRGDQIEVYLGVQPKIAKQTKIFFEEEDEIVELRDNGQR